MSEGKLWTPANKVTLVRILAIPLFVAIAVSPWPAYLPQWTNSELWKPIIAAAVFVAISATDALDGHLARSRNEVTTLGKFLDPLADKILVTAALLVLVELSILPSWVALIIIAREFIVSGIRMVAASEGVVIAASMWGKVKTVTQIVAIVLFLVKATPLLGGYQTLGDGLYLVSWAVMLAAIAFTIISMLDYFSKARDLLGFAHKAEAADVEPFPYMRLAGEGEGPEHAPTHSELLDLAEHAVAASRERGWMIATAESCTGGLVGACLTAVAGSSDVLAGGIISYSNQVKEDELGVPASILETSGAVSGECARAMAEGARKRLGVDAAVSITGIAGPGGGTPEKPVGTVWLGWSTADGTQAQLLTLSGNRHQIRYQSAAAAIKKFLELCNANNPR